MHSSKNENNRFKRILIVLFVSAIFLCGCGRADFGEPAANEYMYESDAEGSGDLVLSDDYTIYEEDKEIHLYTTGALHNYYSGKKDATYGDLREAMNENETITGDFKSFLSDFIDKLEEKYPNIDLTVFYYNIKNADVQYVSGEFMPGVMGATSPKGCFLPEGCKVYINSDCSYDELIQVVPHEIGHMLVNMIFEENGYTIQRDFCKTADYGFMVEEALNSKFVNDLMGIDSEDLPYQMPVNYIETFMDATGYPMEDYLNGSIIDYLNELVENGINEDDAARTIGQMENQKYNIRKQHDVDMKDSEFSCLYEVYSYVYFKNKISAGLSSEEIYNVYMNFYNTLTTKIDYDKMDLTPVVDTLFKVLKDKNIDAAQYPDKSILPITMGQG